MKFKDLFIGQIVESYDETGQREYNERVPVVGKVVDIALNYSVSILMRSDLDDRNLSILPVVHFLGESVPRPIRIEHIRPYEGDKHGH